MMQAQNRLALIIEQTKAAEGVTERMKQYDQMAWIGVMNSIRNRAEEIVLRELICRNEEKLKTAMTDEQKELVLIQI